MFFLFMHCISCSYMNKIFLSVSIRFISSIYNELNSKFTTNTSFRIFLFVVLYYIAMYMFTQSVRFSLLLLLFTSNISSFFSYVFTSHFCFPLKFIWENESTKSWRVFLIFYSFFLRFLCFFVCFACSFLSSLAIFINEYL